MTTDRLRLEPRQAATRLPSDWENDLADVVEAAFAAGAWELDALVERLNASRVRPPGSPAWTPAIFTAVMKDLGA
ncbi:recombinase-like helix-turn-helix domain-containing protein [Arenibaculum sp.]|jgi:hypothetical protein|uniref:recombinase-like helix-turn-helix domain-containing protein n=1 Tax=Arenibaculum sp. TaxID=2865862 RepID=UPI002E12DEE0|nr:recombinase-like helix-turn-helix domain-containing protein [Arenibaculum sp.]